MKIKLRLTDPNGVLESIRNAIANGGEEVVVDVEIVGAEKPRFDRTAYMRELMRKRRANPKQPEPAPQQAPPQPAKKPRTKTPKAPPQPMPAIPDCLNTESFQVAWRNWLEHRAVSKRSPVNPVAAKLQLDELSGWGVDVAIQSINQAIKDGWQSIRKHNANSSTGRSVNRNDGNSNGGFLSTQSKAYVETSAQKTRARMQGFADGSSHGIHSVEVNGSGGDGGGGEVHS